MHKSLDHELRVAGNCSGKYSYVRVLGLLFTLCVCCWRQGSGLDGLVVWPVKSVLLCSSLNVVLKEHTLIPLSEMNFRSILKVKYWFHTVYHTVGNVQLDRKSVFFFRITPFFDDCF